MSDHLWRGGALLEEARRRLFEHLLDEVGDPKVIEAMRQVERDAFVPEPSAHLAYEDIPLPIGNGQTISQPYIVALMISALELRRTDKVLEVGTGSGYQAAILAELAQTVVSVERLEELAASARERLTALGYSRVEVHVAESGLGWTTEKPFEAIIVAAGAPKLPPELIDQLAVGGRLVVPVGGKDGQELMKVSKTREGTSVRTLASCRFVPLIGEGAWPAEEISG